MCKNAADPCPGCTKHAPSADPRHMFLTPEEVATRAAARAPRHREGARR